MNGRSVYAVRGVDPVMHKWLRRDYIVENGSLTGLYSKELPEVYVLLDGEERGLVKFDIDPGFYDLDARNLPPVKHDVDEDVDIEKFGFKKDLTYFKLHNAPLSMIRMLNSKYTKSRVSDYGGGVTVGNKVLLYTVGMRLGLVKVAEESRDYVKRVIEEGVTSPLLKKFEMMERGFDELKEENRSLRGMLQTVLDFVKGGNGFKKVNNNLKSHRRDKRVVNVVDSLKMINKSSFTEEEYAEMVDLQFGIGDLRTVRGDLQAAQRRKLVVMRHSKCYFVSNDLYDSVQGSEARRAFNEKVKVKLRDVKEITLGMFKGLVKDLTGLFDDNSVNSRLEGLITRGWLTPLGSHGNIFTVQLD